jgi:hypothetical protein
LFRLLNQENQVGWHQYQYIKIIWLQGYIRYC